MEPDEKEQEVLEEYLQEYNSFHWIDFTDPHINEPNSNEI